jgi:cardiolipin synthase
MNHLQMDLGNEFWRVVGHVWHYFIGALALCLSIIASAHTVLRKRDSRAAIAWVGFIWFLPLVGALLYFIFGVNRLRRQATLLRAGMEHYRAHRPELDAPPDELHQHLFGHRGHLYTLARVVGTVAKYPLLPGNLIEPLLNGDEAYPAMLEAIGDAKKSITFVTYIFDRDEAGLAFTRALGEAVRRGVKVRLLIDAAGTRYSWPSILRVLRREGIPYARFLPAFALWRLMAMNMRTHRKILVVDGKTGFTGGINIRAGHVLGKKPKSPVQDVHFRVRGPVVTQLQEAFADDWCFTTGELLRGEEWFPAQEAHGSMLARGIADGPDEDFEKTRWVLLGAIAAARSHIKIVTPYFVPDTGIASALNVAAMRGVQIDIIIPERSNLPFVHWASRGAWWQVLEHGCRIWLSPPPFDHSKLVVVDDGWVLVGSSNWDARSLRLNFEYNVECYDADLAKRVEDIVETKRRAAHQVTLEEVDGRGLPIRLLDGVARLATPYL